MAKWREGLTSKRGSSKPDVFSKGEDVAISKPYELGSLRISEVRGGGGSTG